MHVPHVPNAATAAARSLVADGCGNYLVVLPTGLDVPNAQHDDNVTAIAAVDLIDYVGSNPNYRREAVSGLVERLNSGEDHRRPQRWEPVVPHDTVFTCFPGYVIKYGGGRRGDRWYYEETD